MGLRLAFAGPARLSERLAYPQAVYDLLLRPHRGGHQRVPLHEETSWIESLSDRGLSDRGVRHPSSSIFCLLTLRSVTGTTPVRSWRPRRVTSSGILAGPEHTATAKLSTACEESLPELPAAGCG